MNNPKDHGRCSPVADQEHVFVRLRTSNREVTQLSARIVDKSKHKIELEMPCPLQPGTLVEIDGDLRMSDGHPVRSRSVRVLWCSPAQDGKYYTGFSFEETAAGAEAIPQDTAEGSEEDHYEVLQLSPNADSETIQRVFRIMAQRYHPDNLQTGNVDLFRKVKHSYDVLIDPDKRASYDARRNALRKDRLKIFSNWQSCTGMEAEKRKRQGVLALLYAQRANNPHQPSMSIRELEDLLACPREHLEFTLWFLKERKYVARSDNNRHSITWEGVAAAERAQSAAPNPRRRRLTAPHNA